MTRLIVLRPWLVLLIARTPLRSTLLPSVLLQPADRSKELQALCDRYQHFRSHFNDGFEALALNSGVTKEQMAEGNSDLGCRRALRWQYVTQDAWLYKVIPWLPYWSPRTLLKLLRFSSVPYYRSIITDTVLIMREGGFNKLSAEDIYEFCVKCASLSFIEYAQQHHLVSGTDPASKAGSTPFSWILCDPDGNGCCCLVNTTG